MNWEAMVTVGRVVRPHGHRGAVIVAPESDFAAERFRSGAELLWTRDGAPARVRVESSFEHHGRWVVKLEGVVTMDEAEALRNLEFRVPADALHQLAPGAHYVHDLEGCRVVTMTGVEVGVVARVDFGRGIPLLAVTDAEGHEVLVPLTESICKEIDTAGKRIAIDPPHGLIELNRPSVSTTDAGKRRRR